MLNVIFTLDYEIHGNGEGCPYKLMVEPTARMLDLFEKYGAKLTIMADVAEILKFREYRDEFGRDDYHYEAIVAQLKEAIRRGHDVQLHLHCSYFNARFENGKWIQDWSEYNFAGLSEGRLNEVLGIGKKFLEEHLRAVDSSYRCHAFRAANWAMNPSRNAVRALINNGFEIDTSVFKYGRREGLVSFDYSKAPSEIVPWFVNEENICERNETGALLEVPIYSEHRMIGAFVSFNRLYRAYLSRKHSFNRLNGSSHPIGANANKISSSQRWRSMFRKHAWKADLNQCSGKQLIRSLERAEIKHRYTIAPLPFVLIGHSKLFTRYNEKSLALFVAFAASAPNRFSFGTFHNCDLPKPKVKMQIPVASFA